MKNISSLKSNDTNNSPKTPGGISKSLLTPCRRLGLSRNWRKSGPSPFISPLASASADLTVEKIETRKRKNRVSDENIEQTVKTSPDSDNEDTVHTPSRNTVPPRKKKSKTLLEVINTAMKIEVNDGASEEQSSGEIHNASNFITEPILVSTPGRTISKKSKCRTTPLDGTKVIDRDKDRDKAIDQERFSEGCQLQNSADIQRVDETTTDPEVVATPVHTRSKKSKKHTSPLTCGNINIDKTPKTEESTISTKENEEEVEYKIKQRSPNDLSKECIVVIQRNLLTNVDNNESANSTLIKEKKSSNMFDSDSDDTPLINIQKQNSTQSIVKQNTEEDDDFIENKRSKAIGNKIKDSKSPKTKLKTVKPAKTKPVKVPVEHKLTSQCNFDDDDDFDDKKTILIRKTYDKVSRPMKAKSTGSITQKDIDSLRDRIEAKKKLLLAQSLTPDTQELRGLIKKWRKGCQDALMELLDLMRNKFSDKQNMDYSEMLTTLKIPPALVGYDDENDCFVTPDDASIILGQFKDIY